MNWYSVTKQPINPLGYNQGYFRYYKTDDTYDEITAIDGKLYKNGTLLPITGLASFQTTRQIEAAQHNDILYIATGTKLCQYDGTECKVVVPYTPTTMEMTFIGSNSLSDNPEGHLQDSVGLVASIDYILPVDQNGIVNNAMNFKVFCTRISGETYEFNAQIRSVTQTTQVWDDPTDPWRDLSSGMITIPRATTAEQYEVRITMRKVGTTTILSEAAMPYFFNNVYTPPASPPATITVHQCNRAFFYWGRLFLFGDPSNPALVYMSHLNSPDYMPTLMTLEFENPRREGLTCMLQYRNGIVAFTKTSTQFLSGTGPDNFKRIMLHTDIGCISPKGAAVMKDYVGFLSQQGVHTLKTSSISDDKASVAKIDKNIEDRVVMDEDTVALFIDNQLQFLFPSTKTRIRFYQDLVAWTYDYSEKFDFTGMQIIDGEIYCQKDNEFYVFDKDVYDDDNYNYTNYFETKDFSLSQAYHKKKLKEFHTLVAPKGESMNCTMQVYADETIVEGIENSYATVVNGEVVWNVDFEPNLNILPGTNFGEWSLGESPFGGANYALKKFPINGNCIRTHVKYSNKEPKENHVIGFAYIFKLRKP